MKNIPQCPDELPASISDLLIRLGNLWAESNVCPQIKKEIVIAWDTVLKEWAHDDSLPLLIRKVSLVRGSEIIHSSGRRIIPADNSPAQWVCHLALMGIVPTITEIREAFLNDNIPVSFAHKKEEKDQRKYHCTLGQYTINKDGWKLCHISAVGLNDRSSLSSIDIQELKKVFFNLLSPSNYFLLPKAWGGLGETDEFIKGYLSEKNK
ncbi:MAG TPA: hypothetical protein PLA83_13440 [Deltaproteobacteria bacterium]|jgi:hypothetical protein|nr:hypothetical protein [Deltaproteobacteria bacterium]